MKDLITNNSIEIQFTGAFGLGELYDNFWSYVLPEAAFKLLVAIKSFVSNPNPNKTNVDAKGEVFCFASYERLSKMTRIKKQDDVKASYQLLSLIGFLRYKQGKRISHNRRESNNYYINKHIYSVNLLGNEEFATHLVNILKSTRVRGGSEESNDSKTFKSGFEKLDTMLKQIRNKAIVINKKSGDKTVPITKVGYETYLYEFNNNESVLDFYQDFLQTIYNIIRCSNIAEGCTYSNILFTFNQPVTGEVNPPRVEETHHGENEPNTGVDHLINQSIIQSINHNIDDDDLAGSNECDSSNLNNDFVTQDTDNPFSKMENSLLSDKNPEFPFEKYAERLFDTVESEGELHFVDIEDLKDESETSLRKTLAGLCHRLLQDESETEEYLDNINSLDRKKLLKGIECFQLFFENEIEAESAYAICKRFTTDPKATWVKNLIGGYQYHNYKKPIQKQKNREFYSKGNGKSTKQSSSPGGSAQKKQSIVAPAPKKVDIEPPDFKSIEQMQSSEEGCPF